MLAIDRMTALCTTLGAEAFRLDFELEAVRRYEDTRPLRAMQQDLLKDVVNPAVHHR